MDEEGTEDLEQLSWQYRYLDYIRLQVISSVSRYLLAPTRQLLGELPYC
jgi:hypothetical protein